MPSDGAFSQLGEGGKICRCLGLLDAAGGVIERDLKSFWRMHEGRSPQTSVQYLKWGGEDGTGLRGPPAGTGEWGRRLSKWKQCGVQ